MPLPSTYQVVDWFPDGSHLLLTSGSSDLWKMSTWDSSLRKLWSGGIFSPAAVSPDGSRIAFVKDGREVWLMGGDGEEPHKILATDLPDDIIGPGMVAQRAASRLYPGSGHGWHAWRHD